MRNFFFRLINFSSVTKTGIPETHFAMHFESVITKRFTDKELFCALRHRGGGNSVPGQL